MTLTAGPARYIALTAVCVATFVVGAAGGLLHDDGRIAEGVWIERVYVGGLSVEEAQAAVNREVVSQFPDRVELRHEARRWSLQNQKFGRRLRLDQALQAAHARTRTGNLFQRAKDKLALAERGEVVRIPVELDRARLEALLGELAPSVDRAPRDARVTDVIGDQLYFEAEADGLRLNVLQSAAKVVGDGRFPPPGAVDLVVERSPAKIHLAQLQQTLNSVLASFRTNMADGYYGVMRENRAHNVRLLIERFNGRILMPGEEWSFNNDLGERKIEDGFKSSIIFLRKPDGTIEEKWDTGGGICQLATTIFNAALRANLRITQRGNHSKTVHYVEPARDATVYYGVQDLRFLNSLTQPVLLWGELRPNYDLVISFIGDKVDDYDVVVDSDFWYGKAGKGGSLWRTVKTPGGEVVKNREHVCDSFYPYEKEKVASPAD